MTTKQIHGGAIKTGSIRDMLQTEFRLDIESAVGLIRKWFPQLTENDKRCANCGASMVDEIYSLDCLDAAFIFEMGKAVRERVRKNLSFTEANQVHTPTLAATDAIRHRTTKCAKLGLVAKVLGADGKQVQGYWVITARGFAFLRGEPVPRQVAVWRRKIQERFQETTTIDQVLMIRSMVTKYRREDWFEFGKAREGALIINMRISKPYSTRLDMQWKGRSWFTGMTRRLTDEEARSLLEQGLIYEVTPKRFVILDGKEMTWGEYLKRCFKGRETKKQKS